MKFTLAAAVILTHIAFQANASCLNSNADTRLRTFCVAETLIDKAITLDDALLLDKLLKLEGISAGIGLPNTVAKSTTKTFVTPTLDYNTNINGGNPNRPLVLGNLIFTGEEALLRREGIVVGAAAGINGRTVYGNGDYLDYAVSASYAHSPQYNIGIARGSANVCSRNHIANQWYVDACSDATRLVRDLEAETNSGLSLSTAKLFTSGNGAYHNASVGVRRYDAEEYQQNQVQLGWKTVRNRGAYTGFNLSIGEAVPNQLAQRRSLSATLGTTVFGRALTATVSYSHADGGRLLGFERNDTTRSLTVNYALNTNLSVTMGFRTLDSSIDYFNEREPIISVQFAPIRF